MKEAFYKICDNATVAKSHCVSLYYREEWYGGPEEGGWWGNDTILVAYQHFSTKEAAEAALAKVEKLAKEKTEEAKRSYGDHCLRQTEWLEERGLEDDFLREPDGPDNYFVVIEDKAGSQSHRGARHYE